MRRFKQIARPEMQMCEAECDFCHKQFNDSTPEGQRALVSLFHLDVNFQDHPVHGTKRMEGDACQECLIGLFMPVLRDVSAPPQIVPSPPSGGGY